MSEFKVGSKLKEQVVCTMQPLILCLHKYNDDITKCVPEINIFERTCSKKVNYVHDRIEKIYGCVEKTKKNLEDIISNYNKLVDNVKSTQVCNIQDIYKNELNEIEKDIVKNVWLKKYDKYEFLFENPFFEKKNKDGKRRFRKYNK